MQDNLIVFPEPPPDDKAKLDIHVLPVSLTSLIGREQEVQTIQALLLRPDVRLLTLTGTAGVGKTRLAFEVAWELVHDFADGVHAVSLAPISDPDLVVPTIAHYLGLMESGSQPVLELLKTSQRDKQRLLVLDNFEHVIEAAPRLSELLEACPDVKILVTSREVLRLRGEQQFVVPPLALPDPRQPPDAESLPHIPSVNLFLQRAQAIQSDFNVTTDNAATIAEICIRLDGLPLALELAAARVKLFPPQTLLARLEQRLQVLTSGARDAPVRQQSLRNTIAWSYELLPAEEQRLFRQLSVFVGGCTLEAIEALCTALGKSNGAGRVLDGVASLIDKSLLQQTEQGEEPRFVMLETIREYGLEILAATGEMETTRQAHVLYYLTLAEEAEPELAGSQQAVWLERLELEHENLRTTMQWLLEQEGTEQRREMALRLGGALLRFWDVRGHWNEGRSFLERALAGSKGVAVPVQVQALKAAARLAFTQGDTDRAEALYEECLAWCRELGDTVGIALFLRLLGAIAQMRGNFVVASSLTEEALVLFREVGDKEGIAWSLNNLASIVRDQGEYSRAISLSEEALTLFREVGHIEGIAFCLGGMAYVLFISQDDPAKVRALVEESLALFREMGDKEGIARALNLLGEVFLQQGDTVKARLLLEESVALLGGIGYRFGTAESLSLLGGVETLEGDYAAARAHYEESLALAREVDDKEGIALYMEGLANVVALQEEPAWATQLWGAAQVLRETIGAPLPPIERVDYDRSVAAARAQLGEKAFDTVWSEGRTMSLEQVLEAKGTAEILALIPTEPLSPSPVRMPPTPPAGLTTHEMEVLRLLAQGLTSAQIAEQLTLSVLTVNTHLRSIYSKLGVTSRSAATRWAMEQQLV